MRARSERRWGALGQELQEDGETENNRRDEAGMRQPAEDVRQIGFDGWQPGQTHADAFEGAAACL